MALEREQGFVDAVGEFHPAWHEIFMHQGMGVTLALESRLSQQGAPLSSMALLNATQALRREEWRTRRCSARIWKDAFSMR
jgi:hypothetical protein